MSLEHCRVHGALTCMWAPVLQIIASQICPNKAGKWIFSLKVHLRPIFRCMDICSFIAIITLGVRDLVIPIHTQCIHQTDLFHTSFWPLPRETLPLILSLKQCKFQIGTFPACVTALQPGKMEVLTFHLWELRHVFGFVRVVWWRETGPLIQGPRHLFGNQMQTFAPF